MSSRSLFHQHQFTHVRLVALCTLLLIAALVAFKAAAPHSFTVGAAAHRQQPLSFEARVTAGARHRRGLPPAAPLAARQARSRSRRSTPCCPQPPLARPLLAEREFGLRLAECG